MSQLLIVLRISRQEEALKPLNQDFKDVPSKGRREDKPLHCTIGKLKIGVTISKQEVLKIPPATPQK